MSTASDERTNKPTIWAFTIITPPTQLEIFRQFNFCVGQRQVDESGSGALTRLLFSTNLRMDNRFVRFPLFLSFDYSRLLSISTTLLRRVDSSAAPLCTLIFEINPIPLHNERLVVV